MKEEKIAGSGEGLLHSALLISQAQALLGSLSSSRMEAQGCRPQRATPSPEKSSTRAGSSQNPGCKGPHHSGARVRTSRGDGDASRRRPELFKEVPVVSGGQ